MRHARAAKRGHHHGLFRARRPDDGHALRPARPRGASVFLEAEKLGLRELTQLLHRESGLLGVSASRRARRRCSKPSAPTPRARGARALRAPHRARDRRADRRPRWPGHARLHRRRRRRSAALRERIAPRSAGSGWSRPRGKRRQCFDDLARKPGACGGRADQRGVDRRLARLARAVLRNLPCHSILNPNTRAGARTW